MVLGNGSWLAHLLNTKFTLVYLNNLGYQPEFKTQFCRFEQGFAALDNLLIRSMKFKGNSMVLLRGRGPTTSGRMSMLLIG